MRDDADETIARIGAALRPLPDVDPSSVARVLVAVAAERDRVEEKAARTRRLWRWAGAGGALVAAAALAAVTLSDPVVPGGAGERAAVASAPPPAPTVVGATAGVAGARLAARDVDGVPLHGVELVFRAPDARRVSVVGDFNGWDAAATTMTRDPASGLWSQTVLLRPGRHIYAFVIDDSVWARDPKAPAASDPDFGRPGSVLLVGRP